MMKEKGTPTKVMLLRVLLLVGVMFLSALLVVDSTFAGSVRAPGNDYEREARDKCGTPAGTGNRVFGASWANNGGGQFSTRITATANQTSVNAGFYSTAFLCTNPNAGTRRNIRGINISSNNARLSFAGTSIFRDSEASAGQFTTIPGSQPLGITINISGLASGRHSFNYTIQYQDHLGTGVAGVRTLTIDLVRSPPPDAPPPPGGSDTGNPGGGDAGTCPNMRVSATVGTDAYGRPVSGHN
jgi:hypothetical protein